MIAKETGAELWPLGTCLAEAPLFLVAVKMFSAQALAEAEVEMHKLQQARAKLSAAR